MAARQKPKRQRPLFSLATLRQALDYNNTQAWNAAQSIARDALRVKSAAETLERITKHNQAQGVIDRLVPEVEALLELVKEKYDDPALCDAVMTIADRLGID